MLDIDERGQAAALLRLRNHSKRERRFTGRFRTENFNHAAAWESAYAQSAIDQDVAGRDYLNINDLFGAQAHDRAFTVVFCDLLNCEIQIFVSCGSYFVSAGFLFSFCGHIFGGSL